MKRLFLLLLVLVTSQANAATTLFEDNGSFINGFTQSAGVPSIVNDTHFGGRMADKGGVRTAQGNPRGYIALDGVVESRLKLKLAREKSRMDKGFANLRFCHGSF